MLLVKNIFDRMGETLWNRNGTVGRVRDWYRHVFNSDYVIREWRASVGGATVLKIDLAGDFYKARMTRLDLRL